MGENYFYRETKQKQVFFHLGKKSIGWRFTFKADPSLDIFTYQDFKNILDKDYIEIFNEYQEIIEKEKFFKMINSSQKLDIRNFAECANVKGYLDSEEFNFCLEWFS